MQRSLMLFACLWCYCSTADAEEPLQKILFGSCIKQALPMPILSQMAAEKGDAMIFLGDNIYGDTTDMRVMREKYQLLGNNPDFQRLKVGTPVYAVWDDHDYGVNDGGADFAQKVASQKEFMDFWETPQDSPLRSRVGTYDSTIIGPVGKRVQLLLLDTRFFRSALKKGEVRRTGGPYVPDSDPGKTMLGTEQWSWLEKELQKPAEVRVIASSIQCLASDAGQETWSNLPRERERLFSLLKKSNANGVFIISGDRHWAEFSMVKDLVNYPLYDFTSSSINQTHPRGTPTGNLFRANDSTYHLENYGVIEIDWSKPDVELKIEIRDFNGQPKIGKSLKLSELQN